MTPPPAPPAGPGTGAPAVVAGMGCLSEEAASSPAAVAVEVAFVVRPPILEDAALGSLEELQVAVGESNHYQITLRGDARAEQTLALPAAAVYGHRAGKDHALLCPERVERLVRGALQGQSCTIMAYGNTGAGKSFSMGLESRGGGCSPHSVAGYVSCRLFALAREQLGALGSLLVEVAMAEVHSMGSHDRVKDLLRVGCPVVGRAGAPLMGLSWHLAPDPEAVQRYMLAGSEVRSTGAMAANARSSRSHAIFIIRVSGDTPQRQRFRSELMLADLAGSERAAAAGSAESVGFRQGTGINIGLLELGKVITDLAAAAAAGGGSSSPLPQFRNHPLTLILRPALGGSSSALIIGCISPMAGHQDATLRTLSFCAKAGTIKNAIRPDLTALNRLRERELAAQVEELKSRLREAVHQREAAEAAAAASGSSVCRESSGGCGGEVWLAAEEHRRLVADAAAERLRGDVLEMMLARVRQRPVQSHSSDATAGGGDPSLPTPAPAAAEEASAAAAAVAVTLAPVASALQLAGLGPAAAAERGGLESDDDAEEERALSAGGLVLEGYSHMGEDPMALLKLHVDASLRQALGRGAAWAERLLSSSTSVSGRAERCGCGAAAAALASIEGWAELEEGYLNRRLASQQLTPRSEEEEAALRRELDTLRARRAAAQSAAAAAVASASQPPQSCEGAGAASALLQELGAARSEACRLRLRLQRRAAEAAAARLVISAYNDCLGAAQEGLAEAAEEVAALRVGRETFLQVVREKLVYAQQAAAAQQALAKAVEDLTAKEEELAAAQEAAAAAASPPRFSLGKLMGKSPGSGGRGAAEGPQSPSHGSRTPSPSGPAPSPAAAGAGSQPGSPSQHRPQLHRLRAAAPAGPA